MHYVPSGTELVHDSYLDLARDGGEQARVLVGGERRSQQPTCAVLYPLEARAPRHGAALIEHDGHHRDVGLLAAIRGVDTRARHARHRPRGGCGFHRDARPGRGLRRSTLLCGRGYGAAAITSALGGV